MMLTEVIMIEDFMARAVLAGLGVAIVAGPLGCVIVWRRMVYFGAALSHAGLLGVALALLLRIDPMIGVLVVGLVMVPALVALDRMTTLSSDTLLGLMAHGLLALGLVLLAFMPWVRVDLMAYLFGDVLTVNDWEIGAIYAGGLVVLGVLWRIWRPLLAGTVSAELAGAEGLAPERNALYFMLLLAVVIALAMKVVGVLLLLSLLVIPPSTARSFARSPEEMALHAALLGSVAVAVGLAASRTVDTPAGPSIVVASLIVFLLVLGITRLRKRDRPVAGEGDGNG